MREDEQRHADEIMEIIEVFLQSLNRRKLLRKVWCKSQDCFTALAEYV